MRQVPRPKNHLDSFRYAVEGIVHTFRTQKHMRFHFFTVVLVLLIGLLLRLSRVEMAILFIVVSGVLVTEMLNTAIESVVDMITQAYHPLAKLAKDIAAGAVLIASTTAAVVGGILFFGSNKIAQLHLEIKHDPLPVTVILAVVVLVLIIGGHAAVSFFLASTLIYRAMDYFTGILALLLAFLVAQSRVEGKIHTLQEVIIGGLLGILFTCGIYFVHIFPAR
jgi:diacylglycerol kinase (ATP)